MSGKLLAEHHFEFLSLQGGCTGSSEFTLVKIPHRWKSHVAAQLCLSLYQHPYFVYESSKGSGESVHLRRLALAFIAQHCVVKRHCIWATTSSGICEQQRRRPACASAQSDQRLCCSLMGKLFHFQL